MGEKKKLLYLTRYSLDEPFNLQKKFDGQLAAFANLGFEVYFIGYDRQNLYLVNGNNKTVYGKTHFAVPSYLHTQFYNDLHKAAIKAIKEIGFDYLYWRAAPLFGSSCKVAEAAKANGATFILEIPTFPPGQESHLSGIRKAFSVYSNRFSERFGNLVDYYVVIGDDAGGSYKGKPAINIENGIDVNSIKKRSPKTIPNEVHILAVSAMRSWHGYDKLIKSLAAYKGDQNVFIHLVGGLDGECTDEWKNLAVTLGVADNVIFHGYMYGNELDNLSDMCDLGCASLRRGNYAHISELKTREYTARGLPFILALNDKSFVNAEKKFWLQISNNDDFPDMNDIVSFATSMREDREIVSYMRHFAKEYLTWDNQYRKMFGIIEGKNSAKT